jgi:phosphoribosylanthranilate isomerase
MSFPGPPSTRFPVKICGIATPHDAAIAVAAGADAIGLLVELDHPSPDELQVDTAAAIAVGLPTTVTVVLVTHRVDPEGIEWLCRRVRPGCLQLHGVVHRRTMPELRERLPGLPFLKALHPEVDSAVDEALLWSSLVDGLLLDTRAGDRIGGTGITHDWELSAKIVAALPGFPVILAGGLGPENVADAVRTVRPWGVDVNSGVRAGPARKDPQRVRAFVQAARAAHPSEDAPAPRP